MAKRDARLELLERLDLFAGCSRRELQRVASFSTEVTLPAGTVVCSEGDVGHEAFVLADGTVAVSTQGHPLGVLRPGTVFGEMALLEGRRRTATVIATSAISVLVMTRQELVAVIEAVPSVAAEVGRTLHSRKRELAHVGV